MKSTRDRILQTLLNNPRSSINELAEAVGINAISVRHHLTNLQADLLVTAEEERHGVGRPRLVYFLTEKGVEKFPTRYLTLTNRLISQLKGTLQEKDLHILFKKIAQDLAAEHSEKIKNLPIEQKLDSIKEILHNEGFDIEWNKEGDGYRIREVNCPYIQVGVNHPEVCEVDKELISTMLSLPVEKINCILKGDRFCTYLISAEGGKGK